MLRRKTKMISFRVSPDDYIRLRDVCTAEGLGSVSDLARSAIETIVKRHSTIQSVPDELSDLRQRVEVLAADIDRLARRLDTIPPADSACAVSAD